MERMISSGVVWFFGHFFGVWFFVVVVYFSFLPTFKLYFLLAYLCFRC